MGKNVSQSKFKLSHNSNCIYLEPPPTYESLFGELRQAREESSGVLDFLKKVVILLLSTSRYFITLKETMNFSLIDLCDILSDLLQKNIALCPLRKNLIFYQSFCQADRLFHQY